MEEFLKLIEGTKGLIIAVVLLICAIGIFTPSVYAYFALSDPLPSSVRADVNAMDLLSLKIKDAASAAKGFNSKNPGLGAASREYQAVADQFNKLIDQLVEGVRLNRIDAAFFDQQFSSLNQDAHTLLGHLNALDTIVKQGIGGELDFEPIIKFFKDLPSGWQKVFAQREKMDELAIKDLQRIKWPAWGRI